METASGRFVWRELHVAKEREARARVGGARRNGVYAPREVCAAPNAAGLRMRRASIAWNASVKVIA